VQHGGWLAEQQFLDAVALVNMMPAPLVTFVTLVGWVGGKAPGAIVMTVGIFLPAFSFTIIGHHVFEKIVGSKVSAIALRCPPSIPQYQISTDFLDCLNVRLTPFTMFSVVPPSGRGALS